MQEVISLLEAVLQVLVDKAQILLAHSETLNPNSKINQEVVCLDNKQQVSKVDYLEEHRVHVPSKINPVESSVRLSSNQVQFSVHKVSDMCWIINLLQHNQTKQEVEFLEPIKVILDSNSLCNKWAGNQVADFLDKLNQIQLEAVRVTLDSVELNLKMFQVSNSNNQ